MGYTGDKKREYQRLWVARRKEEFFKDKSCVKCGSTERLELDHVDPSKKVSHSIWSWSETRRNEELVKCQILCYNCHLDKTIIVDRQQNRNPHDQKRYMDGCRCDECKASHAKNNREWRWRTGRRVPRGAVV